MSGPERPEPAVPTTPSLKRKHLSDDQQHDLDALDNIFKRIKTKVPRIPYILSTPSLDPYRYHSQQEANAWTMGGLWRHDEEHIQYRTYLYREPCQDCFELQAGEEEEPDRERERTKTVAADVQPVKKKVNLSTFKVKQANGTTTPGMKTSSPSLAPIKHGPDKTNGVNKSEKSNVSAIDAKPKSPIRYALKHILVILQYSRLLDLLKSHTTSFEPRILSMRLPTLDHGYDRRLHKTAMRQNRRAMKVRTIRAERLMDYLHFCRPCMNPWAIPMGYRISCHRPCQPTYKPNWIDWRRRETVQIQIHRPRLLTARVRPWLCQLHRR